MSNEQLNSIIANAVNAAMAQVKTQPTSVTPSVAPAEVPMLNIPALAPKVSKSQSSPVHGTEVIVGNSPAGPIKAWVDAGYGYSICMSIPGTKPIFKSLAVWEAIAQCAPLLVAARNGK